MDLFNTGIRPLVDEYLKKKSEEVRDYGNYWSASSAGYCMRYNILKRLKIPSVPEIEDDQARTTRVFESGHIFHEWIQRITKDAGISIAQENELQDEDLMIRGHFDDLVLIKDKIQLIDYKTAHSMAFEWKKKQPLSHYHTMQLATYMYMLRKQDKTKDLEEARLISISKDDLRLDEKQLLWTPNLEKEIVGYWKTLNGYWSKKTLPKCTCLDHDGGFLGKRSKKGKIYNPFFYEDEPCSIKWVVKHKDLMEGWKVNKEG